jgi:hypothetical protein
MLLRAGTSRAPFRIERTQRRQRRQRRQRFMDLPRDARSCVMNVKFIKGEWGRSSSARGCGGHGGLSPCGGLYRAKCKPGRVDSLAPARSALAGFWLRPDSFRRLPGGSSHKICDVIYRELAKSNTYLPGMLGPARTALPEAGFSGFFGDFRTIHMGGHILSAEVTIITIVPEITCSFFSRPREGKGCRNSSVRGALLRLTGVAEAG